MEQIINYIKPELLVLIPVIYFLGQIIKSSNVNDKYIPAILGIVSILLSTLYVLATATELTAQNAILGIFVGVTQGVLCAGCSVYVNQIVKQNKK